MPEPAARPPISRDQTCPQGRPVLTERPHADPAATAPQDSQPPAPRSLGEVLDAVEKLGHSKDEVSVESLVDALGRASVAALILVPAMIATTPLSGIPGLSAFCGIMIAVVAAQGAIGRRKLSLPGFIMRRSVDGDKLVAALHKISRVTDFLDRHTHERLDFLVRGPGAKLLLMLCVLGGLMMPFLEFIPFSASIVASCILLISLSVLTLDGVLAVLSFGIVAALAGAIWYFV